jgi:hypothetical protein
MRARRRIGEGWEVVIDGVEEELRAGVGVWLDVR